MSLEQTIGNLEIRYANVVTFVGSSNTMVDTTTGRIQTKGFQHNSNVITDISGPHGRIAPTLKKYPEIAFGTSKVDRNDTTNTYVQAGYTVTASSYAAAQEPYRAFDYSGSGGGSVTWTTASITNLYGGGSGLYGTVRTSNLGLDTGGTATPQGGTRENGEWITLQIPNKITLSSITISRVDSDTTAGPKDFQLYGSNDGTTWVQILSVVSADPSTTGTSYTLTSTPVAYTYFGLVVTRTISRTDYMTINDLIFYGTEENPPTGDHSVDTTFKSRFNNPQLTGVQVLVDGATGVGTNQISGGPDPSGNNSTYDATNKYYTLNGTLTSNLAVEANTFLEGDQPHTVSVWFNSSNLEANVSNTCVFSIASEEKLDSVNLDLQSNTWHNLTYAYQGEGGSKVAYLDGRKVAEDQAEDTFGDYPPFAMTGYSQGGYVVSASSEYDTSYPIWEAFNNVWHNNGNTNGSDAWLSENATNYNGSGGLYSKSPPRNLGTGAHDGEWVKIEMPHKFKLNYITIYPRYQHDNKAPRDFIVYGSNDNVNWSPVLTKTGASITSSHVETGHTFSMDVYDTCYKYFGLVIRKLRSDTTFVAIAELKLYGHRENDLVRLPDPTNVLKYPHVVMTGPAQRGYVASASSLFEANDNYHEWKPFDGSASNDVGAWLSEYSPVTYDGSGNANETDTLSNIDGVATPVPGSWLKLELPHKLKLSKVLLYRRGTIDQKASLGFIYGSNDDINWTTIGSIANGTNLTTYTTTTPMEVTSTDTTNSYKYFIVQVTKVHGNYGYASFGQVEFYGTGVDSIPIQIGGGNIDKVANFRVYDKFVGEDQALEIWDAQKDEFGRAKSSMTLQKGRLGIGTDEPEGRLAVADEPDPTTYGLQEFPPRAMTDYETYMEGHGVFKGSASSDYTTTGNGSAFSAFDKNEEEWTGDVSFSSGALAGIGLTTITNGIGAGPWVQLELPYKILLKRWAIQARTSQQSRHLKSAILVGSNDGNTWDTIQTVTNQPSQTTLQYRYYDVSGNNKYHKYLRLVITEVNGGDRPEVNELRYFGYREQVTKQSVLHDGQLTLTKNLTVPRIGPAFVEYPTPRQDKIHLQYDTSLSIHHDTHIMDTSGRSIDLSRQGNGYYNSGTESLHFDGNDSYYNTTGIGDWSDNQYHTHSLWVKTTANSGNPVVLWNAVNNSHDYSGISINAGSHFSFWHFGNDHNYNYNVQKHVWYHVVAVYNGNSGTQKMYINGEEIPVTTIGTISSLSMGTNPKISLGGDYGRLNYYFTGEISKYRLHSVALTPEEVFTLYKQGRTTPVHHLQLVDSTMTIGSHNRHRDAQLDVAGHIRAGSGTMHTFTGQHRCFPDEPMKKGLIVSAKKNQFVKLNGFATGQDAITVDESLPIVSLSNVVQDKACFGVVSSIEKSTPRRSQIVNGIISDAKKEKGDNRAIVNSVGEGAIWVVDTNGPLESGDYITTSNVAGYGQKQDDDVLHNFTVAKITMDCDFTGSNVAVQTIKREQTGTRTITEDAWNQLVEYDRYSNVEDEITTYYQIQRGGNVLDENGQLQFEDKTGATEEPYERRFLTS